MSNPLFAALGNAGGRQQGPTGFIQFMNQMRGRNPNEIIQQMLSSGSLTQSQLNQVQQMAKQAEGKLSGYKSMFGF